MESSSHGAIASAQGEPKRFSSTPSQSMPKLWTTGVVAEIVSDGAALARAKELARMYLKVPELTRRATRIHFTQPLKERVVRERGYGLALESLSALALGRSMRAG